MSSVTYGGCLIKPVSRLTLACICLFFARFTQASSPSEARDTAGESQYISRWWQTGEGLPENSVTSVLQTREGYLWIGTLGALARFDGASFTVFDTDNTPGLRSDRVRALFEDAAGSLWIGTEHGGLARYRDGKFHSFTRADGLPSNVITFLAGSARKKSSLIVGTLNGLVREEGGRFAPLARVGPLSCCNVTAALVSRDGELWLGAQTGELLRINGSQVSKYWPFGASDRRRISALVEDKGGNLWVGGDGGLSRFRDGRFFAVKNKDGKPLRSVLALCFDKTGELWIGSRSGLFRLNGSRLTPQENARAGGDNVVSALSLDREGSIWAGTEAAGLEQWRHSDVRWYGAAQGFSDRPSASVLQDSKGTVWIGTLGAGLFCYRGGQFQRFPGATTQGVKQPASLAGGAGSLWLGDWDRGLFRKAGSTLFPVDYSGLQQRVIRAEFIDSSGALWIGTDRHGLFRYRDGHFTHYGKENGLLSNSVVYITEDRSHKLWLSLPEGVDRFDGREFRSYSRPDMKLTRMIYQDELGNYWIGTYGYGLFCLRDGKLTRIATANGLPESVVTGIVPDGRGSLWMSGNRGIYRCSSAELDKFVRDGTGSVHCVSYGAADGLGTAESNGAGEPSAWRAKDGALWFAMVKGVVSIEAKVPITPAAPLVISRLVLGGKSLPPKSRIRISPEAGTLRIDYAALTFLRPRQVEYRYRLAALDKEWVNAGNHRSVTYMKLPPGNYTFQVQADDGYGTWNLKSAALGITVVPFFWQTSWFFALCLALATACTYLFHFFSMGRLRRAYTVQQDFSRQLIEAQERERERIAAELHDGLGQDLLIIQNRAYLALNSLDDREITGGQLEEISSSAAEAIREARTIAYDLHPYRLERFGLTKSLRGVCQKAATGSGIEFHQEIEDIDGLFPREVEKSIFRVVQEAVNNIVKHSQSQTALLEVRRTELAITLHVADHGVGFDPLEVENKEAHGFGFIGMRERIRMLNGSCRLVSAVGKGTSVDVTLPLRRE